MHNDVIISFDKCQTSISMHCDIVHSAVHCVAQIYESEKFKEVFECLHLLTEYSEQTFKNRQQNNMIYPSFGFKRIVQQK